MLSFATRTWDGWDYIPDVWDRWLTAPDGVLLVATVGGTGAVGGAAAVDADGSPLEEGQPVAVTRLAMLSEDECWLEGIRVDPRVRGMNVATDLQVAELRWAVAHGMRVIRYATGQDNEGSHRLGARHGITLLGAWLSYGVDDEDDLCATVADPDQSDRDCDGGGDACDDDADGDSVPDDLDACPDAAAYPIELVEDGCPDDACDLDVWIGERDTSEISAQMVRSLRAQAGGACSDTGTTAGMNKLGALANHVAAQSGKKVSAQTAELLLGSIDWIETAWTCESSGAGCDALDPCAE